MNECQSSPCRKPFNCHNTFGGYSCRCPSAMMSSSLPMTSEPHSPDNDTRASVCIPEHCVARCGQSDLEACLMQKNGTVQQDCQCKWTEVSQNIFSCTVGDNATESSADDVTGTAGDLSSLPITSTSRDSEEAVATSSPSKKWYVYVLLAVGVLLILLLVLLVCKQCYEGKLSWSLVRWKFRYLALYLSSRSMPVYSVTREYTNSQSAPQTPVRVANGTSRGRPSSNTSSPGDDSDSKYSDARELCHLDLNGDDAHPLTASAAGRKRSTEQIHTKAKGNVHSPMEHSVAHSDRSNSSPAHSLKEHGAIPGSSPMAQVLKAAFANRLSLPSQFEAFEKLEHTKSHQCSTGQSEESVCLQRHSLPPAYLGEVSSKTLRQDQAAKPKVDDYSAHASRPVSASVSLPQSERMLDLKSDGHRRSSSTSSREKKLPLPYHIYKTTVSPSSSPRRQARSNPPSQLQSPCSLGPGGSAKKTGSQDEAGYTSLSDIGLYPMRKCELASSPCSDGRSTEGNSESDLSCKRLSPSSTPSHRLIHQKNTGSPSKTHYVYAVPCKSPLRKPPVRPSSSDAVKQCTAEPVYARVVKSATLEGDSTVVLQVQP